VTTEATSKAKVADAGSVSAYGPFAIRGWARSGWVWGVHTGRLWLDTLVADVLGDVGDFSRSSRVYGNLPTSGRYDLSAKVPDNRPPPLRVDGKQAIVAPRCIRIGNIVGDTVTVMVGYVVVCTTTRSGDQEAVET